MNDSIEELIYSLNYITNMLHYNHQEARLLLNSPKDNLNRINRLFSDNHKLIILKKEILQNDKLKHLSENEIKDLQIRYDKKIN